MSIQWAKLITEKIPKINRSEPPKPANFALRYFQCHQVLSVLFISLTFQYSNDGGFRSIEEDTRRTFNTHITVHCIDNFLMKQILEAEPTIQCLLPSILRRKKKAKRFKSGFGLSSNLSHPLHLCDVSLLRIFNLR